MQNKMGKSMKPAVKPMMSNMPGRMQQDNEFSNELGMGNNNMSVGKQDMGTMGKGKKKS